MELKYNIVISIFVNYPDLIKKTFEYAQEIKQTHYITYNLTTDNKGTNSRFTDNNL